MNTIKCQICKSDYRLLFDDSIQGDDCACFFNKDMIYGAFGTSLYDFMEFKVLDYKILNNLIINAPICDNCMTSLLENKQIKCTYKLY
jgi:hypothetical protein